MNKNKNTTSHALEMLTTGLVSFSFAPITVIAMSAIFSLAL